MAFEKREILFTLPEIRDALIEIDDGKGEIPLYADTRILEALHTRDNHKHFHVIRERYARIYKDCLGKNGVMFRVGNINSRGNDEIQEFFLPEDLMAQAILRACKKSGVMLPRSPQKQVVAEDLYIGFRFEVGGEDALMLEEA